MDKSKVSGNAFFTSAILQFKSKDFAKLRGLKFIKISKVMDKRNRTKIKEII